MSESYKYSYFTIFCNLNILTGSSSKNTLFKQVLLKTFECHTHGNSFKINNIVCKAVIFEIFRVFLIHRYSYYSIKDPLRWKHDYFPSAQRNILCGFLQCANTKYAHIMRWLQQSTYLTHLLSHIVTFLWQEQFRFMFLASFNNLLQYH